MKKTAIMLCILIAVAGMVGCASSGGSASKAVFNYDDVDTDNDNRVSREEYDRVHSFDAMDENRDGSIDRDEFSRGHRR